MENKDRILEEQQAPLKNTDNAFVKVGHDGEPIMPKEEKREETENQRDRTTELDKR
jgi:hypothetical protein